ncbi:MAG: class I SAM-dependent methyltransferase family protein, partial [Desulfobacterales bacterium]
METAKKPIQIVDTSPEVSPQEKIFLLQGSKKYPIHAKCASKYSLFFRCIEEHHLIDLNQAVSLVIQNKGDRIELGPCRVISGLNLNGYAGCLVFTPNVYDIESLLKSNKIIKLQSPLIDVPTILARKYNISPCFKEYTANLCYDLSVYKITYDELDSQYKDEPEEIKTLIQNAILDSESEIFLQFFQKTVDELKQIIVNFNEEEHQIHGFYFRKQVWNYILCGPLIRRAKLKPRGFAGDSEMMSMIYRNAFEGETTFGKLLHKYAVETATGDSVRYRRKLIRDMLHRAWDRISSTPGEKIRVLSVACGPAVEINDILASAKNFGDYHLSLLDQDQLALDEARQLI